MGQGHSTEEKLQIMYEDSLRDIRDLATRMESVAGTINVAVNEFNKGKAGLRAENEKILMATIAEIKSTANQMSGVQENIASAAANAARAILLGDGGPVQQLNDLVRQQNEALGWLNRAAEMYGKPYSYKTIIPYGVAAVIGGLIVRLF